MKRARPLSLLAAVCSLAAPFQVAAQDLSIAGSDLIGHFVTEPLKKYAEENGVVYELSFEGSSLALEGIEDGSVDFAIVALPDGGTNLPKGARAEIFAHFVSFIVVDGDTPLDSLTVAQVGGVFATTEQHNINLWRDLGISSGGFTGLAINPVAFTNERYLALDLLRAKAAPGSRLKNNVIYHQELPPMLTLLREDQGAIGVLPKLTDLSGLKVVAVAKAGGSPALPTPENVADGDYPLTLPLAIVFRENEKEKVRRLAREFLSDRMAKVFEENHYVPLTKQARDDRSLRLDLN